MLGLDASRFELSMIILSFDASWPGRMRLYQEHAMCSSHTQARGLEPWLTLAHPSSRDQNLAGAIRAEVKDSGGNKIRSFCSVRCIV